MIVLVNSLYQINCSYDIVSLTIFYQILKRNELCLNLAMNNLPYYQFFFFFLSSNEFTEHKDNIATTNINSIETKTNLLHGKIKIDD